MPRPHQFLALFSALVLLTLTLTPAAASEPAEVWVKARSGQNEDGTTADLEIIYVKPNGNTWSCILTGGVPAGEERSCTLEAGGDSAWDFPYSGWEVMMVGDVDDEFRIAQLKVKNSDGTWNDRSFAKNFDCREYPGLPTGYGASNPHRGCSGCNVGDYDTCDGVWLDNDNQGKCTWAAFARVNNRHGGKKAIAYCLE